MNPHLLIPAVGLALILAGCQSHPTQPSTLVVNLTSATPVSFSGHLKVDGKDQSVSGTTPAEYKVTGKSVTVDLRQGPEDGLLTAQVRIEGDSAELQLVTASNGPNTDVRGALQLARPWYTPW